MSGRTSFDLRIGLEFVDIGNGRYLMRCSTAHIPHDGQNSAIVRCGWPMQKDYERKEMSLAEVTEMLGAPESHLKLTIYMIGNIDNATNDVDFEPAIWEFLRLNKSVLANCDLTIWPNARPILMDNWNSKFAIEFLGLFANLKIMIRVKFELFDPRNMTRFIPKLISLANCKSLSMGRGICSISKYSRELFEWLHQQPTGRLLFFETRFESPHELDPLLNMLKEAFKKATRCCQFVIVYIWDDYEPWDISHWSISDREEFFHTRPFEDFTVENETTGEIFSLKVCPRYGGKMRIGELKLERRAKKVEAEKEMGGKQGNEEWTKVDIGL